MYAVDAADIPLIFDDVTDLLLLRRSPHTHLHPPPLPVYVDEAVVGLGRADEVVVVAAGLTGVGKCPLRQLGVSGSTVTPHCGHRITVGVSED